mgnify:CR=1 FL=1
MMFLLGMLLILLALFSFWNPLEFLGIRLESLGIPWDCLVSAWYPLGIPWNSMVSAWYSLEFLGIPWNRIPGSSKQSQGVH